MARVVHRWRRMRWRRLHWAGRWAVAVAAPAAAGLVALRLAEVGLSRPYLFFLTAVGASAGYGGVGPGLLSVLLAGLAINYFFREPVGTLALSATAAVDLGLFVAVALPAAWFGGRLRASEERHRALFEDTADAVLVADRRGHLVDANPAACALLGYDRAALRRLRVSDVVAAPPGEGGGPDPQAGLRTGELELRRRDGARVPAEVRASTVRSGSGRLLRVGVLRDLTEHRMLERERARTAELLAAAAERERVAMDLHDGGVQALFGLAMALGAAERRLGKGAEPARAALREARAGIDGVIGQLRGYIEELRATAAPPPRTLRERLGGLAGAAPAAGVSITLHVDPVAEGAVAPEMADHLVYAAYEAASNAVRHSGARIVEVRLAREDRRLALTVRDDGRGFDPDTPTNGNGLTNLRRRAALLGGTLTVGSPRGRGTLVRLEVPLGPGDGATRG